MSRYFDAAVCMALVVSACTSAAGPRPAPREPGRLVIVGGGLSADNESVYRALLAGRTRPGPVCIIPTAGGGDAEGTIRDAVGTWERWGGAGAARGLNVSIAQPAAAGERALVEQIRGCSAFWFTGGVQSRIVTVFRPAGGSTPAYEAIVTRYRDGAAVGGSSAGAAIMSDPMIAGGSTTGALQHPVVRIPAEADEGDDAEEVRGIALTPGLGFLPGAIVDQHFLARGRIGRLITVVLDVQEYDLGFGVDENTALVIDGQSAHVTGASGVVVLDASAATRSGRSGTGIRLHLLGAGDAYHMERREYRAAVGKSALPPSGSAVTPPENLFARWAFLHLLHQFAASTVREITVEFDGGQVRLRKTNDFAARASAGVGVQGVPQGLGVTGVLLDVMRPN